MSLVNKLSQLFRLRGSNSGIPSAVFESRAPLFQRIPPWWARWTVGLVACDIFITGSAIDLTWRHWSTLVSDLENVSTKDKQSKSSTPDHYVPRPVWQRLGLCVAHLGFGVGLAVALVVTQARFVRTFAILPPALNMRKAVAENRSVFLQCAHNWKNNGIVFPISKCSLEQGRNETEMIFRVAGERGHWYIGLHDALIHGRQIPFLKARAAILTEWTGNSGKRVGQWTQPAAVDYRWKSGPVRRID